MNLIRIFFVVVLMALANYAQAADAVSTLKWTAPTTRMDGTALSVEELSGYKIYYAVDGDVTLNSQFVEVGNSAVTEEVVLDLTPRAEPYVINFAIVAVDIEQRVSQLSESVAKTFLITSTAEPGPPTELRFTITCGAGCNVEIIETNETDAGLGVL